MSLRPRSSNIISIVTINNRHVALGFVWEKEKRKKKNEHRSRTTAVHNDIILLDAFVENRFPRETGRLQTRRT